MPKIGKTRCIIAFLSAVLLISTAAYSIITRFSAENDINGIDHAQEAPAEEANQFDEILRDAFSQIAKQSQAEESILQELNTRHYSFEAPLVVIDPYGMSPLAALAIFTSDEPLNISVTVPGKTQQATIEFTFDGYDTSHIVPIYGLYPNELNTVILTALTQSGTEKTSALQLRTDPLPPSLEQTIIITDLVSPDNYQPGLNFTFINTSAFDLNGDYRWYYNDTSIRGAKLYGYNGNIIISKGAYHQGDTLIMEISKLGRINNLYYSEYGFHHDVIAVDGGNLLISGSRGDTIEDFIYEINVDNGDIANTLDLKTVLQRTRTTGSTGYTTQDWFHHNATAYEDGHIIISGRHQSAAVKLSWPDGEIKWILSNHDGWNQLFHKYLLTPIGDGFQWHYDQHTPVILSSFDNNPDTIDILMFDNGGGDPEGNNSRLMHDPQTQRAINNNEIMPPEKYSRMVHYRINEKEMTVEQIWQYGTELGETYYSSWQGSAGMLDNGNRLAAFDRYSDSHGGDFNTSFIEVDASGNIVWEAYATSDNAIGNFSAYRLERRSLYTGAANALQIGIPVRIFIPEDMIP